MKKCPELRFKGFDRNWTEKTFRDFSSVQMCRRIFKSETKTKDEVPFFKIGTFGSIPDAFISRELYQEYIDKYPYPEIGDVLISASGTIGRTVIYKGESAYYQDSNIIWLKLDKSKISNNFLLPFYALEKWNNIEGSTIKRLYNSDLLDTKINYPILMEQESIGVFFQNLDQSIALQEKKLAQAQNLKKAMLEKMFPKAGSKQPEIRLNGFSGGWELQPLENIFGKIRNAFVGTATPYYVKSGRFYLESNNVKDGKINRKSEIFINDYFYYKQQDKWLKTNDIVMVQSGHVGHAAVITEELNNSAAHALIMFTDYKVDADPHFINYQIQTDKAKNEIDKITTGNTIKHILSSDMKKFGLLFPCFNEQRKIGKFFQQLDETLVLQQQQLQTLKNLKQAFLEKMFV